MLNEKSKQKVLNQIYQLAGLNIHDFEIESESQEYGACRFRLGDLKVVFRTAKTTPKKVGQFVVLWKRATSGVIAPYHLQDDIDFFVIEVQISSRMGQFVFPKHILYEKGVLAGKDSEGKRAIRVYPPWDVTTSRQAENTQRWQCEYFFELTANREENTLSVRKRFAIT